MLLHGTMHWQVMMQSSRTMFGKHKHGYIFPVLMNANALDNCFAGVIQKLECPDEFIWFYSKSLLVCEATEASYHMMGVRSLALPSAC